MPGFAKLFEDERPGKRLKKKNYSQQSRDTKGRDAAGSGRVSKACAGREQISPLKGKQGLMALTD